MDSDSLNSLVGLKIQQAYINHDDTILLLATSNEMINIRFFGECCAQCFLAHVNNSQALLSTITAITTTEWVNSSTPDSSGVVESMGVTIQTLLGSTTLETRLEHNGYYSGDLYFEIVPYFTPDPSDFKLLTDF